MSSTTRPMLTVETDDATAAAVAPTRPLTPRRAQRPSPTPPDNQLSNRALALVLMGFILSVLDFFIVNVALPTMGRDLHASVTSLELVVSGYGITYALLLVLGGRLGDAVGRRRLFLGGMAAFTLTSLMCGVAPTATVLIAARAMQGSAAAFMVPQVLATIQATTAGPARARAVGFYSAAAGLAMVAGQLLGGAIVSADIAGTGWRGIFLVNVPIGAVVFTLARRAVPENRSDNPAPIDAVGTLLLATTLVCLLVP
jgi:MFS family permease